MIEQLENCTLITLSAVMLSFLCHVCSHLWNTLHKYFYTPSLCLSGVYIILSLYFGGILQHEQSLYLFPCFGFIKVPKAYWLWPSILSSVRSDTGKFRYSCKQSFSLQAFTVNDWYWKFVKGIAVRRSDLVGLIMRRNELANDILKASTMQQLPPMTQVRLLLNVLVYFWTSRWIATWHSRKFLQCLSMCKGCRHLNVCSIYHKVIFWSLYGWRNGKWCAFWLNLFWFTGYGSGVELHSQDSHSPIWFM